MSNPRKHVSDTNDDGRPAKKRRIDNRDEATKQMRAGNKYQLYLDFKNVVLACEETGTDFITQITQFAKGEYSPNNEFTFKNYTDFLKRMGFDLTISGSGAQKEVVFINKDTKDSIRFQITKNSTASSTTTTRNYAKQGRRPDSTVWCVSQLQCAPEIVLPPSISQPVSQPISKQMTHHVLQHPSTSHQPEQPSSHVKQSVFAAHKASPADQEQDPQWLDSFLKDEQDQNQWKDVDPNTWFK